MKQLISRASGPAALVVAILALSLASGLTGAYAMNKVTTKQLAMNAVTSPKIKDGTIQRRDLAPATVRGLRGATGGVGPAGPPGPAGAGGATGSAGPAGRDGVSLWANVSRDGEIVSSSPGVTSEPLGPGNYLIDFGRPMAACAVTSNANTVSFKPIVVTVISGLPGRPNVASATVQTLGDDDRWSQIDQPVTMVAAC